jgi:hypothetical protein
VIDPSFHHRMLELAQARSVLAATAPEVVASLPPAPGLHPSVPERLQLTHELGRLQVALLESKVGKKPQPAELGDGLSRVLRPYGLHIFVDPEGKPPKRFRHWRE